MKNRGFTKADKRMAKAPKPTRPRKEPPRPPKVLGGWVDLDEAAFGKRKPKKKL